MDTFILVVLVCSILWNIFIFSICHRQFNEYDHKFKVLFEDDEGQPANLKTIQKSFKVVSEDMKHLDKRIEGRVSEFKELLDKQKRINQLLWDLTDKEAGCLLVHPAHPDYLIEIVKPVDSKVEGVYHAKFHAFNSFGDKLEGVCLVDRTSVRSLEDGIGKNLEI